MMELSRIKLCDAVADLGLRTVEALTTRSVGNGSQDGQEPLYVSYYQRMEQDVAWVSPGQRISGLDRDSREIDLSILDMISVVFALQVPLGRYIRSCGRKLLCRNSGAGR
jgi:hypothetical protein